LVSLNFENLKLPGQVRRGRVYGIFVLKGYRRRNTTPRRRTRDNSCIRSTLSMN
jgi:hypothetical protein